MDSSSPAQRVLCNSTERYRHKSALNLMLAGICLISATGLSSCGRSSTTTTAISPKSEQRQSTRKTDIQAPITTVTSINNVVMIELPLGSANKVAVDDFFRVYAADNQSLLKGMIQITEVVDNNRCIARLAWNQGAPIVANDIAKLVSLIDELAPGDSFISSIEQEIATLDNEQEQHDKAHAKLRKQYQDQLAQLQALHQSALESTEQRFIQRESDLLQRHHQALGRQRLTHVAENAAMRDQLSRDAQQALREDRARMQQRLDAVSAQREQIATELNILIKEHQLLQKRIGAQLRDQQEQQQRHRDEMAAEIETREILLERIRAFEQDGPGARARPILGNNPRNDEPILTALERHQHELEDARQQLHNTEKNLNLVSSERDRLQQQLAQTVSTLDQLNQSRSPVEGLQNQLDQAVSQQQQLQTERDGAELRLLRAEQSYYTLASQLLQIQASDAEVRLLQQRLRQNLAIKHLRMASDPASPANQLDSLQTTHTIDSETPESTSMSNLDQAMRDSEMLIKEHQESRQ